MDVLRPLFDDLAKETLIINEASQPFPPARERLFLPLFFSTLAQPPAGNSSTLELLPLLTKPDRRKDARSIQKSGGMVADTGDFSRHDLDSKRRIAC